MWYPGKNVVDQARDIPDNIRDRRRGRREGRQTGIDAPDLGRGSSASDRLTGMSGAAGGRLAGAYGQQGEAMGLMAAAANGQGPSVAQNMLQQQSAQNIAAQQSMMAQGRGGNLAAQQQGGAAAGAAGAMGLQQQAGLLRAQEMTDARGQYGAMANQMVGQGLQQQIAYEQMLAQANAAQLQADLGQRGLNLSQVDSDRGFGLNLAGGIMGAIENGAKIGMGGFGPAAAGG